MTFTDLQREVLQRSFVCGGGKLSGSDAVLFRAELEAVGKSTEISNPVFADQKKSSCLLAAATIVLSEKGTAWARANWEDFIEDTLGRLSTWVSILLFFFGGVGFLWMLAKILLPILIDWIEDQEKMGACGSSGGDAFLVGLANGASEFLEQAVKEEHYVRS